jgi:hypothetical protein
MGEVIGEGREVEQLGGEVFFGRHQSLTHHNKWMLNGSAEVEKYRHSFPLPCRPQVSAFKKQINIFLF